MYVCVCVCMCVCVYVCVCVCVWFLYREPCGRGSADQRPTYLRLNSSGFDEVNKELLQKDIDEKALKEMAGGKQGAGGTSADGVARADDTHGTQRTGLGSFFEGSASGLLRGFDHMMKTFSVGSTAPDH